MDNTGISIRYDDGRKEYVLELSIPHLRTFEASGSILSEAFNDLAEQLDQEGI